MMASIIHKDVQAINILVYQTWVSICLLILAKVYLSIVNQFQVEHQSRVDIKIQINI